MPKTEPGKENSLPGSVCVPLRGGNGDWEVQTDSRFFFDLAGAKKKLGKKKAPKGVSPSADGDEDYASSTAPPFWKRRAKTFYIMVAR